MWLLPAAAGGRGRGRLKQPRRAHFLLLLSIDPSWVVPFITLALRCPLRQSSVAWDQPPCAHLEVDHSVPGMSPAGLHPLSSSLPRQTRMAYFDQDLVLGIMQLPTLILFFAWLVVATQNAPCFAPASARFHRTAYRDELSLPCDGGQQSRRTFSRVLVGQTKNTPVKYLRRDVARAVAAVR